MSEFEREERYAVIKYKKLSDQQWTLVPAMIDNFKGSMVECVVVESDWPEYNFVWLMLEHRMAGFPVPDFNAVKCAADVQAAQSELAALRAEVEELHSTTGAAMFITLTSELAALREELAAKDRESEGLRRSLIDMIQRGNSAEQRNAELTKAITDAEYRADQGKVWNGMGWTYTGLHSHGQQKVLDILRAALKPTESGASE